MLTWNVWHDQLDEIKELIKRDTDALGFLPTDALKYYATSGGILAAGAAATAPIAFIVAAYARPTKPTEAHVYMMCTEKAQRRRGHASRVLKKFEARCLTMHVESITLEVRDNLPGAVRFWQHHGYRIETTKPAGKRRGGQLLCMRKSIYNPSCTYSTSPSHASMPNITLDQARSLFVGLLSTQTEKERA